MIEFTEDDRAALREVSNYLDEMSRLEAADIEEEGSHFWSLRAQRAAYFAGRLAGLAGRVEIEDSDIQ